MAVTLLHASRSRDGPEVGVWLLHETVHAECVLSRLFKDGAPRTSSSTDLGESPTPAVTGAADLARPRWTLRVNRVRLELGAATGARLVRVTHVHTPGPLVLA